MTGQPTMDSDKIGTKNSPSDSSLKEWQGVTIGMWADSVLHIHPNTEWVRKPHVQRDEKTNTLIVDWYYEGAKLHLEYANMFHPQYGHMTVYAVQRIEPYSKKPMAKKKRRKKVQR